VTTYLEDIAVGSVLESGSHTLTASEITAFCLISGDHNPLHTDDAHARTAGFRERIAHGLLVVSIASGLPSSADDWVLNTFLEESRRFRGPVYPGDTIHMISTVTDVRRSRSDPTRGVVTLSVEVRNQRDEIAAEGIDVVMVGAREDA
jgi:acyl dehydratase